MPLKVILLITVLFLSSCGYRVGLGDHLSHNATVSVPYVCEDQTGFFTAELIHALEVDSYLRYSSCNADYELGVSLGCINVELIGFRYEQTYEGVLGKRLVASEAQMAISATVTLKKAGSHCLIVGPFCVSEVISLDYEPETSPQNLAPFSMGQLDFEGAASDAAKVPLYRKLAKKIVDYLNASF